MDSRSIMGTAKWCAITEKQAPLIEWQVAHKNIPGLAKAIILSPFGWSWPKEVVPLYFIHYEIIPHRVMEQREAGVPDKLSSAVYAFTNFDTLVAELIDEGLISYV